jgi:hypothetical protein
VRVDVDAYIGLRIFVRANGVAREVAARQIMRRLVAASRNVRLGRRDEILPSGQRVRALGPPPPERFSRLGEVLRLLNLTDQERRQLGVRGSALPSAPAAQTEPPSPIRGDHTATPTPEEERVVRGLLPTRVTGYADRSMDIPLDEAPAAPVQVIIQRTREQSRAQLSVHISALRSALVN